LQTLSAGGVSQDFVPPPPSLIKPGRQRRAQRYPSHPLATAMTV